VCGSAVSRSPRDHCTWLSIPASHIWGSSSSMTSPALVTFHVLDCSCPDKCEMAHSGFGLLLPRTHTSATLRALFSHSCLFFFKEMSVRTLCPFVNWVLCISVINLRLSFLIDLLGSDFLLHCCCHRNCPCRQEPHTTEAPDRIWQEILTQPGTLSFSKHLSPYLLEAHNVPLPSPASFLSTAPSVNTPVTASCILPQGQGSLLVLPAGTALSTDGRLRDRNPSCRTELSPPLSPAHLASSHSSFLRHH
jgi:hypothetical protein